MPARPLQGFGEPQNANRKQAGRRAGTASFRSKALCLASLCSPSLAGAHQAHGPSALSPEFKSNLMPPVCESKILICSPNSYLLRKQTSTKWFIYSTIATLACRTHLVITPPSVRHSYSLYVTLTSVISGGLPSALGGKNGVEVHEVADPQLSMTRKTALS